LKCSPNGTLCYYYYYYYRWCVLYEAWMNALVWIKVFRVWCLPYFRKFSSGENGALTAAFNIFDSYNNNNNNNNNDFGETKSIRHKPPERNETGVFDFSENVLKQTFLFFESCGKNKTPIISVFTRRRRKWNYSIWILFSSRRTFSVTAAIMYIYV